MSELPPTDDSPPATPPPVPTEREAELEERVKRLEAALAERPAPTEPDDEDAVADRVIAKLSAIASSPREGDGSDRVLVLDTTAAPRGLVPVAPPPPNGAVLHPPQPPADPTARKWFVTQLWAETRLIFRMYFDHQYRISRTTQFAMPGIIGLLIFNYFFFSWVSIAVISPISERLLAVFLGVVGYKLLLRETTRYREVLDYLARYGHR